MPPVVETCVIAQLTDVQEAVSGHFQKGGGFLSVFLVILGIAAVIALVAWLSRRQEAALSPTAPSNPHKLYRDLLARVNLTVGQRSMLKSIARDLRLPHPTAILLCPELFNQYTQQWRRLQERTSPEGAGSGPHQRLVDQTRLVLFPPENQQRSVG